MRDGNIDVVQAIIIIIAAATISFLVVVGGEFNLWTGSTTTTVVKAIIHNSHPSHRDSGVARVWRARKESQGETAEWNGERVGPPAGLEGLSTGQRTDR